MLQLSLQPLLTVVLCAQMRLQTTANLHGVNAVLFALLQAHAIISRQPHTLFMIARDTVYFYVGGVLLPYYTLYRIEFQARQRFLDGIHDLEPADLGEFWTSQLQGPGSRE